jgi:hypothetical protein
VEGRKSSEDDEDSFVCAHIWAVDVAVVVQIGVVENEREGNSMEKTGRGKLGAIEINFVVM